MGLRDLYRKGRTRLIASSAVSNENVSFNNQDVVHSQANVQNYHGPTYHGPVYEGPFHIGNTERGAQLSEAEGTGSSLIQDEDILHSLAFPEMLARRANVEEPHGDSCQWILQIDDYQAWTSRPRGLLWIKGKPGAGKSVLMAYLHNRLKQQCRAQSDVQLDFFFSARGAELQRTPTGMIRALLNQLYIQDMSVRPQIGEAYAEKRTAFGRGLGDWEWQRRELELLFLNSVLRSACHRQVYIFVDALDETGDQPAREIATFLHKINDRAAACSAELKICISSRHYPVPTVTPGVEIYVERYNGGDILKYIQDHFVFYRGQGFEDREAWLELKSDLIERAAGIFQWVCLIIHLIEGYVTEGYSPKEIQLRIRQVPQALSDVYEYILRNIIKRSHMSLSLLLFQWVCTAEVPLSTKEMRHALAANYVALSPKPFKCHEVDAFIKTDMLAKSRINSLSGGLVEVTDFSSDRQDNPDPISKTETWSSAGEIVQVIHQSVNEFLLAHGLKLMYQLLNETSSSLVESDVAERCHRVIFRSCLNYIVAEVSNAPEVLVCVRHPASDLGRLSVRLPLLKYAIQNMFIHAKKSTTKPDQYLKEDIASLYGVLDDWVHCYGYLFQPAESFLVPKTTLLHAAAAYNATNLIKYLLDKGMEVDVRDSHGETALHIAAHYQHTASAEVLSKAGAGMDARNGFDQTPLTVCICRPEPVFAEWLLSKRAKLNYPDSRISATPLWEAASRGHTRIIERLISAGADVNAWSGIRGTALRIAASTGELGTVKILIKAGANTNLHGQFVAAPLNSAAEKGHLSVVELLLQMGANVNALSGIYGNGLQSASYAGTADVVRALIKHGADVNLQGGRYGTMSQAWVAANHDPAMYPNLSIKDLHLVAGADVNVKGGEFGSALQAASCTANELTLEELVDVGVDVNVKLYGGETALLPAVASGNESNTKHLLASGASALVVDVGGLTPMHYGARSGSLAIIKVLVFVGSHINQQDGLGRTPLHLAFTHGHTDLAWTLINQYGADMTVFDAFGRLALDYIFQDRDLPPNLWRQLSTHRLTPRKVDTAAIKRYLSCTTEDLLRTKPRTTLFRLYELIHCLVQISDHNITWPFVNMLIRLQWHRNSVSLSQAACSLCFKKFDTISDPWYVCKECPFFDMCSQCTLSYPPGTRSPWCCNHEVFNVQKPAMSENYPGLYNWFGLFEHDFLNFETSDLGELTIADFCKPDD